MDHTLNAISGLRRAGPAGGHRVKAAATCILVAGYVSNAPPWRCVRLTAQATHHQVIHARHTICLTLATLVGLWSTLPARAFEVSFNQVTDGVYAYIGDTDGRSYDNESLNANIEVLNMVARVSDVPSREKIETRPNAT